MKTTLTKTLAIFIVTLFAISTLAPTANAGWFNDHFEGVKSVNTNNHGNMAGAMLKFSFGGGPDYYKDKAKKASLANAYQANLTKNEKVGLGIVAAVAVIALVAIANDGGDDNTTATTTTEKKKGGS